MPFFGCLQLRLPRPKSFLGFVSLQTGAEVISLSLLFNKVTGLYGLLAILTGYSLSALQLSMYIYCLCALILTAVLLPHIRKQSPLECLGLSWLYIVDTVLNAGWTIALAINWFANSSALEGHSNDQAPSPGVPDAPVLAATVDGRDGTQAQAQAHAGPQESWASLGLVILFTLIRVYFALVVMAFAQQVLQRHQEMGWEPESEEKKKSQGPFSPGSPAGAGWRGRVGRILVSVGKGYWLAEGDEDGWAKQMDSRFRHKMSQAPTAGGEV